MRPIHWTIIRTDLGQIEIAFFLGLLDGLCKLSQEFDCSLVRMASKDRSSTRVRQVEFLRFA